MADYIEVVENSLDSFKLFSMSSTIELEKANCSKVWTTDMFNVYLLSKSFSFVAGSSSMWRDISINLYQVQILRTIKHDGHDNLI